MFKSDDDRRREAATKAGKICSACGGTGTYGSGFKNPCSKCGGTGQAR